MIATTMGLAMRAVWPCTLLFVSCGGLDLPAEFDGSIWNAPPGTESRVEVDGSTVRLSAPLRENDLPEDAAIAARSVQPDGTTVEVARIWTDDGVAFRLRKAYVHGRELTLRTAVVTADGKVLERSHEIAQTQLPDAARDALDHTVTGKMIRVFAVQGHPGVEFYRTELERADGARLLAECRADGGGLRVARVIDAELTAWH